MPPRGESAFWCVADSADAKLHSAPLSLPGKVCTLTSPVTPMLHTPCLVWLCEVVSCLPCFTAGSPLTWEGCCCELRTPPCVATATGSGAVGGEERREGVGGSEGMRSWCLASEAEATGWWLDWSCVSLLVLPFTMLPLPGLGVGWGRVLTSDSNTGSLLTLPILCAGLETGAAPGLDLAGSVRVTEAGGFRTLGILVGGTLLVGVVSGLIVEGACGAAA